MRNEKTAINQIEKGFNDLDFYLNVDGSQKVIIQPSGYSSDTQFYYNYVTSEGVVIPMIEKGSWILDISTTGINLNSRIGGLIDNIAIENSHQYFIWGFLNKNMQSIGIGLSRWAKSAYTGVASGTKGSKATFTGLTNAYQFTIGARVRVLNSTEWNYGTITSIDSTSQIKVIMDNVTGYGNNITSTTTTEIKQFNKHRPWKVSSTAQELYSDYYRLLGWCELGVNETAYGGSNNQLNIINASRWTRKRFFHVNQTLATGNMSAGTNWYYVNCGKFVSPLAKKINGTISVYAAKVAAVDGGVLTLIENATGATVAQLTVYNNFTASNHRHDTEFTEHKLTINYKIIYQTVLYGGTCANIVMINGYTETD